MIGHPDVVDEYRQVGLPWYLAV